MKIIYITTSIEENDYQEFVKSWSISLNPSNQNFHNKIIRSLANQNDVDVLSIRPFSKKLCNFKRLPSDEKTKENIHYHYLKITRNKYLRGLSIKKQADKLFSTIVENQPVIITDTINPRCVQLATHLNKKFKLPCVGICTDSPSNISGTPKAYATYLLNNTKHFDGYITLTEALNNLYNPNKKPSLTFEGIIESENIEISDINGKYLFFGGALLPRYGVYQLIDAFKQVDKKDISLLICGHHENKEQLDDAIGDDNRIKFLGLLPVKEVLSLEANAIANINPRPFTQDFDRLSIPSKTLEYLASGSVTISVRNTELEKRFKDCAIWANSGSSDDLLFAINKALSMSDAERKNMAINAKNTANSLYSIKKIGEMLTDFLLNFVQ